MRIEFRSEYEKFNSTHVHYWIQCILNCCRKDYLSYPFENVEGALQHHTESIFDPLRHTIGEMKMCAIVICALAQWACVSYIRAEKSAKQLNRETISPNSCFQRRVECWLVFVILWCDVHIKAGKTRITLQFVNRGLGYRKRPTHFSTIKKRIFHESKVFDFYSVITCHRHIKWFKA